MHGPVLVGWLLVALCGGAGAYCLLRLRGAGGAARRSAGAEGAMGLLMAVMALPGLPASAGVALGVGAASGAVALWPVARGVPHRAHHAVEGVAMVYMAVAMGAGGGHGAAHGPVGVPALTGALLVYFGLYAFGLYAPRCGPLLVAARPGDALGPPPEAEPEVAAACRLALAAGMFVMLLSL